MKYILTVLPFVFFGFLLQAQNGTATASLDTNKIFIGGQVILKLKVQVPKGAEVIFPTVEDLHSKDTLEVINVNSTDTIIYSDKIVLSRSYTMTSFVQGFHDISSKVSYLLNGQTTVLTANQLELEVAFLPIKENVVAPSKDIERTNWKPTSPNYWKWVLLAIAFLGVVWILKKYVFKNKKAPEVPIVVPEKEISADEKALSALQALVQKRLPQSGDFKEYYLQLTSIFKSYLDDRFVINTLDKSSYESLQLVKGIEELKPSINKIEAVFNAADMVKFAKANTNISTADEAMEILKKIITDTKMVQKIAEDGLDN